MEENSWAGRLGSADDPRRLRMNITKTNIVADELMVTHLRDILMLISPSRSLLLTTNDHVVY